MSETDPKVLKAIETKLTNLVRCVMSRASSDPSFAKELEEVLLTESTARGLRDTKGRSTKKIKFRPVDFLHKHGEEQLKSKLNEMTNHDLQVIVRSEDIRRGKDVAGMERSEMIEKIVSHSTRRLQQGSSFLR